MASRTPLGGRAGEGRLAAPSLKSDRRLALCFGIAQILEEGDRLAAKDPVVGVDEVEVGGMMEQLGFGWVVRVGVQGDIRRAVGVEAGNGDEDSVVGAEGGDFVKVAE